MGNDFCGRYNLDPVSFQLVFVSCAVIAVTGEAVKLPDDNNIKQLALAICNHLLELGSVVGGARNGPICVSANNGVAVALCIGRTFFDLALDGFFSLAAGGVTGINDCIHRKSPLVICFDNHIIRGIL